MKITIKSRWNDKVLFEGEYESTKHALIDAVAKRADLYGADLQGANLQGAYLYGADLQGANLQGADLQGANLQGAYLYGAYLRGANLQEADLRGATLQGAYLYGAYLREANLQEADLYGAYLRGANLQGEKLKIQPILMQLDRWNVIITHGFMQIGCEYHSHKEWKKFNRVQITKMADKAWDWWKEHKTMLLAACDIQVKQAGKIKDKSEVK